MVFFRVTQSIVANTSRDRLARQASQLFATQQQISSGLRIQRPSDDPSGIRRSLIQKDRIARFESHATAIQHVKSRLNAAFVQLNEVGQLIVRARDVALQAPQATTPEEAEILARELDGVLNGLASAANASDEAGYLFGGTAAHTQPFPDVTTAATRTAYHGSSDTVGVYLSGDVDRQSLLPGDHVFQPVDRGDTIILGNTGVGQGQATDSASGIRELQIQHTLTTYAGTSGVAAGTDSVSGDTAVGALGTHVLQVVDTSGTGAFGTVSMNGGPPVSFTNSDTNLRITDPMGEVLYLDTTAIAAGFNGTVNLTSDATLSIDGGTTTTAIDFTNNQAVTDPADGSIVYLDSSNVIRTGSTQLEFPGTSDVFAAVRDLRDELRNVRNLSKGEQNAAFSRRLAELQRVHTHILDVIGTESVSTEQLERLEQRTGDLKLAKELEHSETVSTDISAAVLRLQELTNLQQFTFSSIGRLLNANLLNFLR